MPSSILSQELWSIPKTDSTTVAYYRINEYEKIRRAFNIQKFEIANLNSQIGNLTYRLTNADNRIDSFKNVVIPKLEKQLYIETADHKLEVKQLTNDKTILTADLKAQRGKKWTWGVFGITIGIAAGATATALLLGG